MFQHLGLCTRFKCISGLAGRTGNIGCCKVNLINRNRTSALLAPKCILDGFVFIQNFLVLQFKIFRVSIFYLLAALRI